MARNYLSPKHFSSVKSTPNFNAKCMSTTLSFISRNSQFMFVYIYIFFTVK